MQQAAAEPAVAPPPGNPRFPLFDGLRAIAALGVLVYHTAFFARADEQSAIGPLVARLNVGVTVFFAISGFLLYRPFAAARLEGRAAPRLRDYARRRFLRIVPAYWLALTVLALAIGLPGLWGDWPTYYGFAQVYSDDTVLLGISPAWTLGTELSFYAVLPLYAWALARLLRRRSTRDSVRIELWLLAGLALAAIAFRTLVQGASGGHLALVLPGTFDWFAVGMAMAVVSCAGWTRVERWVGARSGFLWAGAAAAYLGLAYAAGLPRGWVFAQDYSYRDALLEHVLAAIVAALLVLPAAFGGRAGGAPRRLLALPVVAWLGLVSYGIYLWHYPVISELSGRGLLDTFHGVPFIALTVVAAAIVIPVAAASYYGVERPLLRLKDRRLRRGREAPAAAPGSGDAPVAAGRRAGS